MGNNKLKEVCIKNRTCYYFHDVIKTEDFNFGNTLLDERPYENILILNGLYKTLIGAKLLLIMFNKVNAFIGDYDGTKYLALFGLENYNAIYDRIIYLIGLKSGTTYVFS